MSLMTRTSQRLGPRPWAYAAGILVSWVVFSAALGAVTAFQEGGAGSFPGAFRLLMMFTLLPVAVVGSAGVLVLCGFGLLVGSQGWHVAIAAWMGWLVGVLVSDPCTRMSPCSRRQLPVAVLSWSLTSPLGVASSTPKAASQAR